MGGSLPGIDMTVEAGDWPDEQELRTLVERAVAAAASELGVSFPAGSELSLLFTDDEHIRSINAEWRGKDRPTNVLSFPSVPVEAGDPPPAVLGDIVLAAEIVAREAHEEGKPLAHHLTHLLIHGFLHLVGHDHETDAQADAMEAVERRALAKLAIPDPYA